MMRTGSIFIVFMLLTLLMASCNTISDANLPSSEASSEIAKSQTPSLSASENISESDARSEGISSSDASRYEGDDHSSSMSSHVTESSIEESTPKSQVQLIVTAIDPMGTHEEFAITDANHIMQIQNALIPENIQAIERILTFGTPVFQIDLFDETGHVQLTIQDYNVTPNRKYTIMDDKYYSIDGDVWDMLVSYYPLFDSSIKALYSLSYSVPGHGAIFEYYDENAPKAIQNHKEVSIVYDYLTANLEMIETVPNINVSELENRCIRISLYYYGVKPRSVYLCYIPENLNETIYVAEYPDGLTSSLIGWYKADKTLYEALINLVKIHHENYSLFE